MPRIGSRDDNQIKRRSTSLGGELMAGYNEESIRRAPGNENGFPIYCPACGHWSFKRPPNHASRPFICRECKARVEISKTPEPIPAFQFPEFCENCLESKGCLTSKFMTAGEDEPVICRECRAKVED